MSEKSSSLGKIYARYVGTNLKGNRIKISAVYGQPDSISYVNCFFTVGEAIDLISAIEDAIELVKKGG